MEIIHHGARTGVTGSCHELCLGQHSLLVDCGMFQGSEARARHEIDFPIHHIRALLLTHCHIDHVGRLPWLLAAGFRGPIYATEATAALLPLMLEDGLKISLGLNQQQCDQFTRVIKSLLKPIPFGCRVDLVWPDGELIQFCFRPAGHILGSAYIEIVLPDGHTVVFSGDLGPSHTPLHVDPVSPVRADTLVLESTYGDQHHSALQQREDELSEIIDRSLQDGGAILIPAFSVGRTQEVLFDLENVLQKSLHSEFGYPSKLATWSEIPIILDSPLAARVTEQYLNFQKLWAKEAKQRVFGGRHPLSFEQCITITQHADHLALVNRLKATGEPAIVVAASGMCSGGRIMNYLSALLPDSRTDVILVGYQAQGTLGRQLLSQPEQVEIEQQLVPVKAAIHTMSGYSAHADQHDLIQFVTGIEQGPQQIRLVHGEPAAQQTLAEQLRAVVPNCEVIVTALKT
ncbi:MBL fold metallo-hydrolase RNA specificity domain-containing protein [Photobacterium atrarenae]|uniref:MBL fold metallo-hydrolase n=1 Tax=Photobacterium atrarenae TaxID=865757 RepID=A0ABY5GKL0_9GAMM|nr:MBL fold metallo-hydrolase [Photobacterium atrarenae]UTV29306.1 MBL fold metallo-hydrolase [Photobacterium atrarenae]